MKKNILRFFKLILPILLLFAAYKVLRPRHYNVPQSQWRAGTKYWKLSTGSTIACIYIPGTGNKKPYPVIYLHGGPGGHISNNDIEALLPLSEAGFDIYLYDQVGSGRSARLNNIAAYTVTRHINDLAEIISKTGAAKVVLMGQSWGAVLAALFTADNPEKVERLICISPGPIYPLHTELKNAVAPDSLHLKPPYYSNKDGNNAADTWRSKAITFIATRFHKKLAADEEADNFAAYRSSMVNRSTVCDTANTVKPEAGSGFYAGLMTLESLGKVKDPRPALQSVNIPVLILKGQCDNQPWGYTNEYLTVFSNHQFSFIPGAGHFIAVEQPALYLQAIKNFLLK
jgi:proline iminopeptidase